MKWLLMSYKTYLWVLCKESDKMEKLKDIDTFYSQKVIPLAFNESLSYMEQICSLIDYIENIIVPTLNEHTDAINNLQAYVKMLKDLLDKLDKKVDDNFNTLKDFLNIRACIRR